jgi:hypothetical protein
MTLKEIQKDNETMRQNVVKAVRGDDTKWLIGLMARGLWEIAEQLAQLNEHKGS